MKAVDYEKMGVRISNYRSKKGLSQEQLGRMVVADYNHISRVEKGKRRPSLELIIQIANALDVSADDILIDSLEHSTASDEIHAYLQNCTETEKSILKKSINFIKTIFTEFGI